MKLYGIAHNLSFPCLCFGKKTWCFKLYWASKYKRFKWVSWWTTTDEILWNFDHNSCRYFFGFALGD